MAPYGSTIGSMAAFCVAGVDANIDARSGLA